MAAEESTTLRTLGFAAAVALVCSLLVTVTVEWLRPRQAALESLEYARVILETAELAGADAELSDREVVARFLELQARVVDFETDWYTSDVDPLTYDFRALAETEDRPRYMPVYLLESDAGLERIVLPLYGRGMWSTIQATIALAGDLRTIVNVVFYEHGETPGIGDRIEDPRWREQWEGKRIYGDEGRVCFAIQSRAAPPQCRVDGITGATVTVTSVESMIRDWFGEAGYGPFLAALREERGL